MAGSLTRIEVMGVVPGSDDRGLAERRIRRRTLALQIAVLSSWGGASLLLAALTATVAPASSHEYPMLDLIMSSAMGMTLLAPVGVWAGRMIKERDSAARMALLDAEVRAELESLGPRLAALVADARLVCSAIEGQEFDAEVALRSAWEWVHRLEELPEAERRRLEDLGLRDAGIGETLRWTIGDPEAKHGAGEGRRRRRGLARIAEQLRGFEGALLAAASAPYR
ncbi:hypothetical protein G6O69_21965 [Pseudenhygromyxa sp. WMMC2535]|uniref:hypothetical protein n=1 Tax=Pseudenhygromyxa sp. WMMC2535 TaxID=2712867 RepID=UPI001555D1A5|nr:hypothetical protein [Pseudenhygromyxa sp. WMMC2535]NVB40523.1 hypothetical protein [Pseudenhygromyxa sp. WMMC2535]